MGKNSKRERRKLRLSKSGPYKVYRTSPFRHSATNGSVPGYLAYFLAGRAEMQTGRGMRVHTPSKHSKQRSQKIKPVATKQTVMQKIMSSMSGKKAS